MQQLCYQTQLLLHLMGMLILLSGDLQACQLGTQALNLLLQLLLVKLVLSQRLGNRGSLRDDRSVGIRCVL